MGILALACCKGTPQTALVPGAIVTDSRHVFPVLELGLQGQAAAGGFGAW